MVAILAQYWYIIGGGLVLAAIIVDLLAVPEKEFDPSLKRWEKRK